MRDLIGLRRPQICVDLAIVGGMAFDGPRTHKQLFSNKSSSNLRHMNAQSLAENDFLLQLTKIFRRIFHRRRRTRWQSCW